MKAAMSLKSLLMRMINKSVGSKDDSDSGDVGPDANTTYTNCDLRLINVPDPNDIIFVLTPENFIHFKYI